MHTIAVVGPGAIGCLFGAMLREAGHRVIMLDNQSDRARKIHNDGISIQGISGERLIKVEATTRPADVADCDLAIIATKSYDTESGIASVAPILHSSAPVLTLQNGLGNVELIAAAVGEQRTIGGITSQGANVIGAGSIIHAGTGKTIIGTPSNQLTENLRKVNDILQSAGFDPQISNDLKATIWGKLIINVGINALTAIARLNNGRLLDFEGTRTIMKSAVEEAVAVARASGITLAYDNPLAQVEDVCRLTAKNVSSMLQDVLARSRTEIDAINGAIATIGKEIGLATPINETLSALVRTIESSYDLEVPR